MLTIGRIPRVLQDFFQPLRGRFTKPGRRYFPWFVTAFALLHTHTIGHVARLIRQSPHRTKHGDFLWQSPWDAPAVVQAIALDTLQRLRLRPDEPVFLILDDTQMLKRGKLMDAVGSLFHHATKRFGHGHTILKACLYVRGVTIPWATGLYVKKPHAPKLGLPFHKLTELAAEVIHTAGLPRDRDVTVLFDSYYLCHTVVEACRQRGWHWISVGKSNRRLTGGGRSAKLGALGPRVLRRGCWTPIEGLGSRRSYRLGSRTGHLRKIGEVKVVFSRRRGEQSFVALVTDDRGRSIRQVVGDYLRRWAIELLIKEEKQHLGLGAYHVRRYRAVVHHLHLVDSAYACLTHLALKELGAQGDLKRKGVLRLPSIRELKARLARVVWQEAVQDVIKHTHEKPVLRRLGKLLAA